jgi:hypothetical protein
MLIEQNPEDPVKRRLNSVGLNAVETREEVKPTNCLSFVLRSPVI